MPVAKVFIRAQWEAFARALDALPQKPEAEQKVSVRDAMKEMRARVRAAQAKGYTLEQIAEQAKPHGIDITAGAIRYALRVAAKSGAGTGTRPPRGACGVAQGGGTAEQQANVPRPNQVRRDRVKTVTTQPVPVQGTLGFTIRPDTDDL